MEITGSVKEAKGLLKTAKFYRRRKHHILTEEMAGWYYEKCAKHLLRVVEYMLTYGVGVAADRAILRMAANAVRRCATLDDKRTLTVNMERHCVASTPISVRFVALKEASCNAPCLVEQRMFLKIRWRRGL